jgi:hypothetical protein
MICGECTFALPLPGLENGYYKLFDCKLHFTRAQGGNCKMVVEDQVDNRGR